MARKTSTPESSKRVMHCATCPETRTAKGIGAGWQEIGGALYCGKCKKERFRLLALTFPVAECVGLEWAAFCGIVHEQWRAMTSLANWCERQLALADVVRMPGDRWGKIGSPGGHDVSKFSSPYLYPKAREAFPEVEPTTITSVLEAVTGDYKTKRYATVWGRTASHDVQRYPQPIPVHNQTWTPSYDDQGRPCVSLKLGRTTDDAGRDVPRHVTLRLRADDSMRRQLAGFAALMRGEGRKCELSIYGKPSLAGDPHGKSTEIRTPGGGQRRKYKIMCKLVCWLPKVTDGERTRSLLLHTDPHAFWVAQLGTGGFGGFTPTMHDAWILNADHVRRRAAEHLAWCGERDERAPAEAEVEALANLLHPDRIRLEEAQHTIYRQRFAEDTKHEKRYPRRKKLQMIEACRKRCLKHNRCLDDWCKQVVALLVGYARRQKVREIHYSDACRDYLPSFRWSELETTLRNACEAVGIAVFPPPRAEERRKPKVDEDSTESTEK